MEDKIKSIAVVVNANDKIETVAFQSVASEVNSLSVAYSGGNIFQINNATVEWSSNE